MATLHRIALVAAVLAVPAARAASAAPVEASAGQAAGDHRSDKSPAAASEACSADAARLVAALASVDEVAQTDARRQLAAMGDAAVAPLMEVLLDRKAPVHHRMAVGETLIAVGQPVQAALIGALDHPDTFALATAAQVLGLVGDAQAVRVLVKALHDTEPYVRDKAAWALGWLGEGSAMDDLVRVFREDPSVDVRTTSAKALGRLGCRAAVEPLVEGLEAPRPRVRAASAEALGLMGPLLASGVRGELGRKKAAAALVAALADEHWTVRAVAAEALGLMKEPTAAEPLIALLADTDVRMAAVKALGRIASRPAKQALAKVAASEKDESVRQAAEEAIRSMKKP